jgi:hypothetical protein
MITTNPKPETAGVGSTVNNNNININIDMQNPQSQIGGGKNNRQSENPEPISPDDLLEGIDNPKQNGLLMPEKDNWLQTILRLIFMTPFLALFLLWASKRFISYDRQTAIDKMVTASPDVYRFCLYADILYRIVMIIVLVKVVVKWLLSLTFSIGY